MRLRQRRLSNEPIVRIVARVLASGISSRYRYEASCIHGIRAARCLAGDRWPDANKYAETVVRLALVRIGAVAKSFLGGDEPDVERKYYYCQNPKCCKPIENPDSRRFCSEWCRRVIAGRDYRRDVEHEVVAGREAFLAARSRGEVLTRTCALPGCGRTFTVESAHHAEVRQQYCSVECRQKASRRHEHRTCKCGTTFWPQSAGQHFCSQDCHYAARTKERPTRICAYAACGKEFTVKASLPNKYCSKSCGRRDAVERKRQSVKEARTRACAHCGRDFEARRSSSQFCSRKCAWASLGRDRLPADALERICGEHAVAAE